MSNLTAIGLILAPLITTFLVTVYATRCADLQSDAISTGAVGGDSITHKARLMILFQEWVPMAVGIAAFDIIVALSFVQIAGDLADPQIKALAWLSATLAGFGAAGWLVQRSLYAANWAFSGVHKFQGSLLRIARRCRRPYATYDRARRSSSGAELTLSLWWRSWLRL